jgi:hypothetical protein
MPAGYSFVTQIMYNALHNVFRDNILIGILMLFFFLPFVLVYRSKSKD